MPSSVKQKGWPDNLDMRFLVHKSDETVEVLLLSHKNTNTYSFINLTKGHICPCVFDSIDDAIQDMDIRKGLGLLDDYEKLKD